MRHLQTWAVATMALALICPALSCKPAQDSQSRFAGTYIGPYAFKGSAPGFADSAGQFRLTIANGSVTGTAINKTFGRTAAVAGEISPAGNVRVTLTFPGQAYDMTGTVKETTQGNLSGSFVQYAGPGKALGTIETDLLRQ